MFYHSYEQAVVAHGRRQTVDVLCYTAVRRMRNVQRRQQVYGASEIACKTSDSTFGQVNITQEKNNRVCRLRLS